MSNFKKLSDPNVIMTLDSNGNPINIKSNSTKQGGLLAQYPTYSSLPSASSFGVGVAQKGKNIIACDGVNFAGTLDTISDLLSAPKNTGDIFEVKNYHSSVIGGGGEFVWSSTTSKSAHNGGTVIDPTIAFPTDWTNETQKATWFTAVNSTNGVWVRSYTGPVNVRWFGAKGDNVTNDTKSFQAAVTSAEAIYVPQGSTKDQFYLASQVILNGFTAVFGDGKAQGVAGFGSFVRPLTCAFTIVSPDSQNTQMISIVGINFQGGTNVLDFAKCHGIRVVDNAFFNWSGHAICIYRSERGVIKNNNFFLNGTLAGSCMSFNTKTDSIHAGVLTGTDSTMFLDRYLIESNMMGPASGGAYANHFIKSAGIIQGTDIINNTAHAIRLEILNFYQVERSLFSGLTIDGSGIDATVANHYVINISNYAYYCTFIDISTNGGTYFNITRNWNLGAAYNCTFINCAAAAGNNTTTYGFYLGTSNHDAVFINCSGGFYSGMAAADAYRGASGINMINTRFLPSNITGQVVGSNSSNADLVHVLGYDGNGTLTATSKFKVKHSFGGGSLADTFVVDPMSNAGEGGIYTRTDRALGYTKIQCSAGEVAIYTGNGTPEGVVTAKIGSLFMRQDGSAGTSLYVKQSGAGNTGWVGK